jgi:hypothetical protein
LKSRIYFDRNNLLRRIVFEDNLKMNFIIFLFVIFISANEYSSFMLPKASVSIKNKRINKIAGSCPSCPTPPLASNFGFEDVLNFLNFIFSLY